MNKFTKLSGSALFAALLSGSSGIAAHAQNALTTVSSQNMSEATIVRVGCGIGDPSFIDATVVTATTQTAQASLFTMPNMVGLLAGLTFFALAIRMLPEPLRRKCTKALKDTAKLIFHFNTCCLIASVLNPFGSSPTTVLSMCVAVGISLWLGRRFWTEFLMCMTGRQKQVQSRLYDNAISGTNVSIYTFADCDAAQNAVRRVASRRILPSVVRQAIGEQTTVSANAITVSDALPVVAGQLTEQPTEQQVDAPSWYERPDPTPEEIAHFVAALDKAFEQDSISEEKAQLVCHSR